MLLVEALAEAEDEVEDAAEEESEEGSQILRTTWLEASLTSSHEASHWGSSTNPAGQCRPTNNGVAGVGDVGGAIGGGVEHEAAESFAAEN